MRNLYSRNLLPRAPVHTPPQSPWDPNAPAKVKDDKADHIYGLGEERPENQGKSKGLWSKVDHDDAAKQADKLGVKTLEQTLPQSQQKTGECASAAAPLPATR